MKRLQGAGVVHEVDGGSGAHGAEAFEQAEYEENEGLVVRRDAEGVSLFEGAAFQAAAEVERGGEKGAVKVGGEGQRGPDGAGGEESGEDGLRVESGAVEVADGGGFFGGIAEPLAGEGGLNFEDGVDAFSGDVNSRSVGEEDGRVELVEDGDVDLAGAAAVAIDDKGRGGAVGLREIAIEHFEPVMFGGGSGSGGVFEGASDGELGEHFTLDAEEDGGKIEMAGVGCAWHVER
ncbi:MAG: hypothetical protein ABI833_11160 [Acidobacteriota bacterium]